MKHYDRHGDPITINDVMDEHDLLIDTDEIILRASVEDVARAGDWDITVSVQEIAAWSAVEPFVTDTTCVRCEEPSDDLDGWTQRCPQCDENAKFDAGR